MKCETPKLRCTNDYNLFDESANNRDIKQTAIVTESMKQYGFCPGLPICCVRNPKTKKLTILAGHHRFFIAKTLNLPVWFIEIDYELPLFYLEAGSRSWGTEDYLVSHKRTGDETSKEILSFHEKTGISLGRSIGLLSGSTSVMAAPASKQIKKGVYKIKDKDYADRVAEVVAALRVIGFSTATNTRFVGALCKCMQVPEFDIDLFQQKAETHKEYLTKQRSVEDYLDMIELVYNHHSPASKKFPLAFEAKCCCRENQPVGIKKKREEQEKKEKQSFRS